MSSGTNRSNRTGGQRQSVTGYQVMNQPPQIVNTQAQVTSGNNAAFADTDDRDYHQLVGGRNYFQNQNMTIDQQIATMNYLSPDTESGSLYTQTRAFIRSHPKFAAAVGPFHNSTMAIYALAQGYNVITDDPAGSYRRNTYFNVLQRDALVIRQSNK